MNNYSWMELERERERIALIQYIKKAIRFVLWTMVYFSALSLIVLDYVASK